MNKVDSKKTVWMGALVVVVLVMVAPSIWMNTGYGKVSGERDTRWSSTIFEEAIDLSYTPQSPANKEPVNVTISSKNYEPINAAHIYIDYTTPEGSAESGGFSFSRINASVMYVTIPGYEGGTTVRFYVEAWDSKNDMLRSQEYTYVVERNGSWISNDFYENINVTWVPSNPSPSDKVEVIIESLHGDVKIKRAYLNFRVEIPGVPEQTGLIYFNPITPTKMNATINNYPGGTNVTFWIEAYDSYYTKLTSDEYSYSIPAPPPGEPQYSVVLVVVVKDIVNHKYAEDAIVTFSNDTWTYTTKTVNGLALTPNPVGKGHYTISVGYLGENTSQTIDIPNEKNNYTLIFGMNKEYKSVPYGMESGIDVPFILGIIVLLVIGAIIWGYRDRILEELNKEKSVVKEEEEGNKDILSRILHDKDYAQNAGNFGAFLILGFLAGVYAPFYPWWAVILLALVIAGIGVYAPYLATIVQAIFVMASTAYQAPDFGLAYSIFALVVLFVGLFRVEFSYLSFASVYLSRFGLGLLPFAAGLLLFSPLLIISAAVVSYFFIHYVLYTANTTTLDVLFAPVRPDFVSTFSRPPMGSIGIIDIYDAISSTGHVNLDHLNNVLHISLRSPVPLINMILVAVALYALNRILRPTIEKAMGEDGYTYIFTERIAKPIAMIGAVATVILIAEGIFLSSFIINIWKPIVVPLVMIGGVLIGDAIRVVFHSVYVDHEEVEGVGQKISEVQTLRRTTFDLVGGLNDVKRELKEAIIIPLLKPELAKKYGVTPSKGVLLFGPPGCGKTLLMRAIASELNVNMLAVKCSDLMSKWYGESEGAISRLFEEARRSKPVIVFLDEIDAITKRRDFYSTDDVTPRILSIMLGEMDGMEDAEGIIFVGTTNMPDIIDPAIMRPGRFDKVIYVPPPDKKGRLEILKIHTRGRPLADDVDLNVLAKRTKGYTGADIANLVKEASVLAMRESLEKDRAVKISMRHFEEAMANIKPSVTQDMVKAYEKLAETFERRKKEEKKKKKDKGSAAKKDNPEDTADWEVQESDSTSENEEEDLFNMSGEE